MRTTFKRKISEDRANDHLGEAYQFDRKGNIIKMPGIHHITNYDISLFTTSLGIDVCLAVYAIKNNILTDEAEKVLSDVAQVYVNNEEDEKQEQKFKEFIDKDLKETCEYVFKNSGVGGTEYLNYFLDFVDKNLDKLSTFPKKDKREVKVYNLGHFHRSFRLIFARLRLASRELFIELPWSDDMAIDSWEYAVYKVVDRFLNRVDKITIDSNYTEIPEEQIIEPLDLDVKNPSKGKVDGIPIKTFILESRF